MEWIIGARYEFTLKKGGTCEGLLVSVDDDSLFIKLDSGYNEGIFLKNITSSKKLKNPVKKLKSSSALESDPEVLILHTGGTIASRVDYSTGAVTSLVTPEELLALYPELKSFARIGSELISNMPSDDLNFSHYNLISKKIGEAVKKYKSLKGIILTHGTDTLHYTSAALSFALRGLPVPVVLVGSQRSSDRPSSDAASNLLNAAFFIKSNPDFREVLVCMHESENDPVSLILRGTNVRKMHSSRRDAFRPINTGAVASVNYEARKTSIFKKPLQKEEFSLMLFKEDLRIGWIRARPGLLAEELDAYKGFDALVLEGTGLGHFPITKFDKSTVVNEKIFRKIESLSKKLVLIMVSQCVHGRVNLNVYSSARKLKGLGVLGHDSALSPETAYIKLAWLLSNFKKSEIKDLYDNDFVGEVLPRIVGGNDEL